MPTDSPRLTAQLGSFSATDPGSWSHLLNRAKAADAAGVDRVVVSDHVVFGENLEEYGKPESGGVRGGKQPTGPDGLWLEPLTVLSAVSSVTTNVRLGTVILQAALRRPVVLAKTLATLDVLSNGRIDLGVGVGWQREEYEAAGLDFATRGKALDDTLAVCQTLWTEQAANFESDNLTFNNIHCMPKPVQSGGVPIWVSGTLNARVLQRIVRFGAGWIPWGDDAIELTAAIDRLHSTLADAGRQPEGFKVMGSLAAISKADGSVDLDKTMEPVPALAKAGVTDFRIGVGIPDDLDEGTAFLTEIVGAFRQATA